MTFPTVASRSSFIWETDNTTTDHVVDISGLGTISAGDGLLMVVGVDGGDSIDDWGGWTEVMQDEPHTSIRIGVAYKDAVGSDTDPTIVTNGPEKICVRLWRFTSVDFGTSPPDAPSTAATANSTTPDPADFSPAAGSDDYLWLAASANDDDDAVTGFPSTPGTWTDTVALIANGSGGVALGCAEQESAAASMNPNTFTIAATEDWAAIVVAVVGSGGAPPATAVKDVIMSGIIPWSR